MERVNIILTMVQIILILGQGLLGWVLWSLRKQFVPREHCATKCEALAQKQAELAQAQKALPTAAEVRDMQIQLAEIEGDIKTVKATVEGHLELMQRLERPLNLLMGHHLRGEK
jgi:hypothetical protein